MVVVDTGVFGADLSVASKPLAMRYADALEGRRVLISFVTVAELRFGSLLAGWGVRRRADLNAVIDAAEVVWPGPRLAEEYARLRTECHRGGHGLAEKSHEADRWIGATARLVGVPLVSDDSVFVDAPGLTLIRRPDGPAPQKARGRR